MGWSVYLARCSDGTLYCGVAVDVPARIAAHDAGAGARYTRGRGPLEVLAVRRCRDKGTALRIEHAVKRLPRGRKLAALHKVRVARAPGSPPRRSPGSLPDKRRAPSSAGRRRDPRLRA